MIVWIFDQYEELTTPCYDIYTMTLRTSPTLSPVTSTTKDPDAKSSRRFTRSMKDGDEPAMKRAGDALDGSMVGLSIRQENPAGITIYKKDPTTVYQRS